MTATYAQQHETTLDVTISGEVIHTTEEHPFYVVADGRGWVEAGQLAIGDAVLAADGTTGAVGAVTVIPTPQTMYNLTVEWVATYLVGDGQWVVHNVNVTPYVWCANKPPTGYFGVYSFTDVLDVAKRAYYGQGNLKGRLRDHNRGATGRQFLNWKDAQHMIIPYTDNISGILDLKEYLEAAERVLMYNASGGDINLLANDIWQLNNVGDIAKLRRFFENPLTAWVEAGLIPANDKFYRILEARKIGG